MIKKLLAGLLIGAVVIGCSTSPTGRSQLLLVSPDAAIAQSAKAYLSTVGELEQKGQIVKDAVLINRVRMITGRLVTEAIKIYPDSKGWDWSVAIINAPDTLNAWCMAGGKMAIYTGIIDKLKLTDDELAQIMGHEISHALANHTAEQMSRAMLINAGLMAAAVATDNDGLTLAGAALAAKLALELPNSRTAENEADRIGTELATRAGYSPDAAATLWKKMESASGGSGIEFLSTHPSSGNRAAELSAIAPEMRKLNPTGKKSAVYPVTMVK